MNALERLSAQPPSAYSSLNQMIADLSREDPEEKYPFLYMSHVDPSAEGMPTTLDLSGGQLASEKAAVTEFNRLQSQAMMMGKGEEFSQYLQQSGKIDLLAETNYFGERTLDSIFDVLSAGNYASASFVDELLVSGNAVEAFKRAGLEFLSAMPYMEQQDRQKMTFEDVFDKHGVDFMGSSTAAFLLDVFADPINLLPGGILAKGSRGLGSVMVKSGLLNPKRAVAGVSGTENWFDKIFRPRAQIEAFGEGGMNLYRQKDYAEAALTQDYQRVIDRVDRMTANMTPSERVLFGVYGDQPDKLMDQAKKMVDAGLLTEDQLKETRNIFKGVQKYNKVLARRERAWGLLDQSVIKDVYLHGTEPLNPRMQRATDKFLYTRADTYIPRPDDPFPPAMKRRTKNNEERLKLVLSGELNGRGTELDVANIMLKRGFDHARWVASRKLAHGVLDTTAVMPNGRRFSTRVAEDVLMDSKKMKQLRQDLPEDMDVFEMTRKTYVQEGDDIGKVVGSVPEAAYVVPKEIAEHLRQGERVFTDTGDIGAFFEVAEKLTSTFRGWATLSPGFHTRNYMSMLLTNWIRGVGGKYELGKEMNIAPGQFLLRHLQAWKVQAAMDGAHRLPVWVGKMLNATAKLAGKEDFASISDKIKVGDKMMTVEEIGNLAKQYDVFQTIGHMGPTGKDVHAQIWRDTNPMLSVDKITNTEVSAELKKALEMASYKDTPEQKVVNTMGKWLTRPTEWNRAAATIPENNGRLALFIDRLAKGDAPEIAAMEPKKWHFDYRKMSTVEKKVFSVFIPFYAWQRFALPRMAMAMLENPERFSRIPKVQRALENYNRENGFIEYETPDYFHEIQAVQLPAMDDDGFPIYASLDAPWMELNKLNYDDFMSSLNPSLKALLELGSNQNLFTGTPLERFPGEEDPSVNWPFLGPVDRKTRAIVGSLLPPAERYIFRPQELAERKQVGYSLARETGIGFRPLDVRRVLRGRIFERRKLAREFFKRLQQEQEREQGED